MHKLLLFIFLSLVSNISFTQEITQEYIDELIRVNEEDTNLRMEHLTEYLLEIDSLSIEISYGFGQVYAHYAFASLNVNNAPEVALQHISVIDSIALVNSEYLPDEYRIYSYLTKGYAIGAIGNFYGELDYYLKADSLSAKLNSTDIQSVVDQYFTSYYIVKKEYKKALVYNQRLLDFHTNYSDPKQMSYPYLTAIINRAGIFLRMQKPDSAIYYTQHAIDGGLGNYIQLNFSYFILGTAYLEKDDIPQVQKYVQLMNAELDSTYNYTLDGAQSKLLSGNLHQRLKEFNLAEKEFRKTLLFADSASYLGGKIDANYKLVHNYLMQQGADDFLINLKAYAELTDTAYYHKSSGLEKQLMVQFETNKKEKEIQALKYQSEVNRKTTIAVILLALVLFLVILILIYRYKTKKRLLLNALEKEQLTQEITAQDLALKTKNLNQAIEKIKMNIGVIETLKSKNKGQASIDEMISVLEQNYVSENQWAKVLLNFDLLHDNFSKNVIKDHPNLTSNDMRLLVLIKLGYSIKGIAEVNNISEEGVKKAKQRLLKRLDIENFSSLKL